MNAYHSAHDIKRFAAFVCGQIESRVSRVESSRTTTTTMAGRDDRTRLISHLQPHRPLTPPIALGLVRDPGSATGWRREGSVELASKLEERPDADKQSSSTSDAYLTPEMLELGPEHDLDLALEASRSRAYRDLKARIEAAGLFTAPGTLLGYGADIVRYCILGALAAWLYFASTSMFGWFASAVALGAFWHQLTCESQEPGGVIRVPC